MDKRLTNLITDDQIKLQADKRRICTELHVFDE